MKRAGTGPPSDPVPALVLVERISYTPLQETLMAKSGRAKQQRRATKTPTKKQLP